MSATGRDSEGSADWGIPKEVAPSGNLPESSASKTTGRPQQLGFVGPVMSIHSFASISCYIEILSLLISHYDLHSSTGEKLHQFRGFGYLNC